MSAVDLFVHGIPSPKGSPRVVTRGRGGKPLPFPRVLSDSKATETWQAGVHLQAKAAMRGAPPLEGALLVRIVFVLPRPRSHVTKGGLLAKGAPPRPTGRPDVDKLARSTLDGLHDAILVDDSHVVQLAADKVYTAPPVVTRVPYFAPGAWIHVESLEVGP